MKIKQQLASVAAGLMLSTGSAWAGYTVAPTTDVFWNGDANGVYLDVVATRASISYMAGYNNATGKPLIKAIKNNTGAVLWTAELPSVGDGAFDDIVIVGSAVCAAGAVSDDDGDGGDNLAVACFSTRGLLLWSKEIENISAPSSDLRLRGTKLEGGIGLMLLVTDKNTNNELVLGFNVRTGLGAKLP